MVALAQVRRREKGSIFGGSLDRPAYRPSSPLLPVLDVPVLDLHYGGILALVERPAIDRIFLAVLLHHQEIARGVGRQSAQSSWVGSPVALNCMPALSWMPSLLPTFTSI